MKKVSIEDLKFFLKNIWVSVGGMENDGTVIADIFTEMTKRGMGHHDIHNFPSRIEKIRSGMINIKPKINRISAFGALESWDGDHGTGEVLNHFIMDRAIRLASVYGIGMVTIRNSNHYLCSAPYVEQAAKAGCVGIVMAKAGTAMGLPGIQGNLIGQAPVGYAFPTDTEYPVMLDICLAYIAGEPLLKRAENHESIPDYWGHDRNGNPTTDAAEILRGGVKYPIGLHKGFGLALLEELLTGVFSMGAILDDGENDVNYQGTSHTAIAIKTDALMDSEIYQARSKELVERLRARSEKVHIPGDTSWARTKEYNARGYFELEDALVDKLNVYAEEYGAMPLRKMD